MKTNERNGFHFKDYIFIGLPLAIFLILCLLPFVMIVSSSLTSNEVLTKQIVLFPQMFTLSGYQLLFSFPEMILQSYGITIVVTLVGVPLNIVLSVLIAYPLADVDFKYRRWVSFLVFFTMLFNAGLIPTYIVVTRLYHLKNTLASLILMPMLAPGNIFMLRVFFQGVPKEILESAEIEGANQFTVLFKIACPLILPGLATIAFQYVLLYWNDAYTSLYYADDLVPIALYIQRWRTYIEYLEMAGGSGLGGIIGQGQDIPSYTVQFAMGVFSTLPLFVLFFAFQKYFVRGLTGGAVKG